MTLSPSFFYIFVLSRNTQRESQWVPENLLLLLNLLAKSKIKQEALVQCIIKAVTPRTVILPILYRIEIELNNLLDLNGSLTNYIDQDISYRTTRCQDVNKLFYCQKIVSKYIYQKLKIKQVLPNLLQTTQITHSQGTFHRSAIINKKNMIKNLNSYHVRKHY